MRIRLFALCLGTALTAYFSPAQAHIVGAGEMPTLWSAWTFDPLVIGLLGLTALLYLRGTARLWRRAGVGRSIRSWQATCFALGMTALFLALIWPLDALGEHLLTAHMVQHILLLVVAPPLLVLGAPHLAMLRALPASGRRAMSALARHRSLRPLRALAASAWVATLLHGIVLWAWHAPATFEAAYEDALVHFAEHASFLGTGLLFWWVVLAEDRSSGGFGLAAGALCILVTMIHSGLLGVLLTFAPMPLYDIDPHGPAAWGLTPLDDQQLAGLVMWIPAGTIYLLAAVALFAVWLGSLERRRPLDPQSPAFRP